jgi:hypothetical protein
MGKDENGYFYTSGLVKVLMNELSDMKAGELGCVLSEQKKEMSHGIILTMKSMKDMK